MTTALVIIFVLLNLLLWSAIFYKQFFKRFYDIICALLALVVFSWLYLIIAILVKIKLGSPVLFTQVRPGKKGKDGKEKLFNGNKIITTSGGGMLLSNDEKAVKKARFWATQAREPAPHYQHEEIGYNYRMSNIVAGIGRGQLHYLDQHIQRKREIYEAYKEGFKDLPISMNPYLKDSKPNFWLSCILLNKEVTKTNPIQIRERLEEYNIESRPIWKPMHMQPVFKDNEFVSIDKRNNSKDIFERGLCLPSDIKMTKEEQQRVIDLVKECF